MSVGETLQVPVYIHATIRYNNDDEGLEFSTRNIHARIVEIGPCHYELTESKLSKFLHLFQIFAGVFNIDTESANHLKEVLEYSLPSLFPPKEPRLDISDANPLKIYKEPVWDELKKLTNPDLDIETHVSIIRGIRTYLRDHGPSIWNSSSIMHMVSTILNHDIIKQSQFIKVEFIRHPGVFGYYELFNCDIRRPQGIFGKYASNNDTESYTNPEDIELSTLVPQYNDSGFHSKLPTIYTLEQAAAIHSWINHGLLSLYLANPDLVRQVCTHPFVGNESLWAYVQTFMDTHYRILRSIAKPAAKDLKLYRKSQHFKDYPVRTHTIFGTTTNNLVANGFYTYEHLSAKIIHVPAGTLVLDLTDMNVREKEFVIFPDDSNLVIEPAGENAAERRQRYTIRKYNNTRNKNIERAGPVRSVASTVEAMGGTGATPPNHQGGGRRLVRKTNTKRYRYRKLH